MQKVGESVLASVAFAIQRHYWGNQQRIGESACARNVAARSGKFPLKEKCLRNLIERVAAAAAPNKGPVVELDKFPLAASPLLLAKHEE